MEIRIGVQNVNREVVVETAASSDEIAKMVAQATPGGVLDLVDIKGRRVIIPGDAIGYVDIGEESKRRVGFGA